MSCSRPPLSYQFHYFPNVGATHSKLSRPIEDDADELAGEDGTAMPVDSAPAMPVDSARPGVDDEAAKLVSAAGSADETAMLVDAQGADVSSRVDAQVADASGDAGALEKSPEDMSREDG